MKHQNPRILSTSTLSGDNVRNPEGENLGEIKDFMIDLQNGNIVYAVLSFGGFLGIGDKLFAVPWEAFDVDTERKHAVMDIDKEMLEDAPGFNKNDWPESPDHEFINRVHTHYGYEPYYDESGAVRPRTSRTGAGDQTATTGTTGTTSQSRTGGM